MRLNIAHIIIVSLNLFLVSSSSWADQLNLDSSIKLINELELSELETINDQFGQEQELIALNNDSSSLAAEFWTYKNTQAELDNLKSYLEELVLSIKDTDSQPMSELIEAISRKNDLEKSLDSFSTLEEKQNKLEASYTSLMNNKKTLNVEKLKLFNKIINRLESEINNSFIDGSYIGVIRCRKNILMHDCLNQNESLIKSMITDKSIYLNENSFFDTYKIIDANLNFSGDLSIAVQFSSQASLSNEVYEAVNEKLGLKSVEIILKSNFPADWYIDGNKVGTGKKLSFELPSGYHGIMATYNGLSQSSVENIRKPTTLTYNLKKKINKISVDGESLVSDFLPAPSKMRVIESFSHTKLIDKEGSSYFLVIDSNGFPVLASHKDAPTLCEDKRLATYKEYVDLIINSEGPYQKNAYLLKYNLNTYNSSIVGISGSGIKRKPSSSLGISICKE